MTSALWWYFGVAGVVCLLLIAPLAVNGFGGFIPGLPVLAVAPLLVREWWATRIPLSLKLRTRRAMRSASDLDV